MTGREFTVGVAMGMVGEPLEILHQHPYFNTEIKYYNVDYRAMPVQSVALRQACQRLAYEAVSVHGHRNPARVDLRLHGDELMILEVKPNPDIKQSGLLAKSMDLLEYNYESMIMDVWRQFLDHGLYKKAA